MSLPAALADPRLLNAFLSESPNGFIIYQVIRDEGGHPIDFHYQLLNPAAARLLGHSQAELLGRSCQEVFPQADPLRQHYHRVARSGQSVGVEYELVQAGRWFEVSISGPTPDTLLCFFTDITDRKLAQQTLQEENRRLNEAQSIGQVGSFEWNLGEESVYWSDELYRINGLVPQLEPITLETVSEFFHPDDQTAIESLMQVAIQTPGHYALIHRIRLRDGAVRWVNHRFESLANSAGQLVRVHGSVQDITHQRQTQQQLRQTASHLQAVLEASPASIAFLTAIRGADGQVTDLRLVVSNEKFAHLTRRSIHQVRGLSITALEPVLWGERTRSHLLQVLATGHPYYEEQRDASRAGWIGMSATKQDDGVVLTGLDITALKQAQTQLQEGLLDLHASEDTLRTLAQLRESVRQRGEVLRASSHDLRGSIGVISGAASLLERAESEADRRLMLAMLQRNVEQATRMLTELLDYARLEARQEQRTLIALDAAPLLAELGQSVDALARQKGIALQVTGCEQLLVEGDPLHIRRMVQNLLLNAIQHTHRGTVSLAWGLEGPDRWWFSVQDNGPGLSTDSVNAQLPVHPLLVDGIGASPEGFAWDEGLSRPGEGIGLRIVRQLSELLEARLVVTSQAGVGSHFLVSLPQRYGSNSGD